MTSAYRALCSVRKQLQEHQSLAQSMADANEPQSISRMKFKVRVDAFATALAIVDHEIGMLQS